MTAMWLAFGVSAALIVRYLTGWHGPLTPEDAVGLAVVVAIIVPIEAWRAERDRRRLIETLRWRPQ